MKTFKRNAIIIVVALFVCVAAYLNWSYNKDGEPDAEVLNPDASPKITAPSAITPNSADTTILGDDNTETAANSQKTESSGLYFEGVVDQTGYFAEARLIRQQARDAAVATLASVNSTESASQEILDSAFEQIMRIAAFSQQEAELETLVKAKGFDDCVVFMSADGIKVTVPSPQAGLTAVDVAKITDIIISDTDFTAEALSIIEVK